MIENLVLGTARWGSWMTLHSSLQVLDKFVESGGRHIDTATNYPINGIKADHGLANRMLSHWMTLNPSVPLKVFVKVGSVDNSGGPQFDLSENALELELKNLEMKFGTNLAGIGIHWDNRDFRDVAGIFQTVKTLDEFKAKGFTIGLSGIKNIRLYSEALGNQLEEIEIQVKETINDSQTRERYSKYFPKATYVAYGIAGGGQGHKKNLANSGNSPKSTEEKKVDYADIVKIMLSRGFIKKVIIGPRNLDQLTSTINGLEV